MYHIMGSETDVYVTQSVGEELWATELCGELFPGLPSHVKE